MIFAGEFFMGNIKFEKSVFREKYKAKRENLSHEEKKIRDSRIAESLFLTMAYRGARQILLYSAMKDEISTESIFIRAVTDGKVCFFPRTADLGNMYFHSVNNMSEMGKGSYGIKEPLPSAPKYSEKAGDICIVPALSYDREGYRLGYGGGFYDRFLSSFSGTRIGICYSDNLEKRLPRGKYDVCVDILLTEKGIYRLKK